MTALMIIGGGKMGSALLAGLLRAKWAAPEDLCVVEPDEQRAEEIRRDFTGVAIHAAPVAAKGAILATKPATIPDIAHTVGELGARRMVSIAAGVRLATIEAVVPSTCAVIRAMPNTPALVGVSATAIAAGTNAAEEDLAWASTLLSAVGTVVTLSESLIDAVTGLSGSGPAYVFLVAEALIDAGVLNGLDRATSQALATQTLLGAATLLAQDGAVAADLRAAVTSPGGTTAAGLAALEQAGLRAALLDAVSAATARSKELG